MDRDFDMLELDDSEDSQSHLSPLVADLSVSSSVAGLQRDTLSQSSTSTVEMTDGDTQTHQSCQRVARVKIKAGVRERQEMNDRSNLTLTQNGATTLRSSRDPRVDFFFQVAQGGSRGSGNGSGTPKGKEEEEEDVAKIAATTTTLVAKSWKASPLDTLRLIFQLRSVRHGKGERAAFYACLDFLRREHPRTLLYNLQFLPGHGYWKDLLNWVVFECRRGEEDTSGSVSKQKKGNNNNNNQETNQQKQQTKMKKKGKDKDIEMDLVLLPLGYRATTALKMDRIQGRDTNSKLRHKLRRRARRRALLLASSQHSTTSAKDDPLSKFQHLSLSPDKLSRHLAEKAVLDSATTRERARQKLERAKANQQQFETQQRGKARLARQERDKARRARLDHARARFEQDAMYQMIHVEVARLFAQQLKRDKAALIAASTAVGNHQREQPPLPPSLSLAGKWCPSLNQFHDKHTLIATTIARILFPDWLPGETEPAYIHRVRQALRTEYYVPLRKALAVVEPLMTSYQWDEIEYSRVPAVAMMNNKRLFEKYDEARFCEYLEAVRQGQNKIAAAALMPHQLVHEVLHHPDFDVLFGRQSNVSGKTKEGAWSRKNQPMRDPTAARETTELQWQSFVERLKKQCSSTEGSGSMFKSCMAMCDTSESMRGRPLEAAIGLSLLLAELTEPPFNEQVMSFGEHPVLHQLDPGASFADKVASIVYMSAGLNTDLFRAFETLLKKAIKDKVPPSQMVKTLFIFSDMEFDQAVVGGCTGASHGSVSGKKHKSSASRQKKAAFSNYHNIQVLYRRKGYELPRIVFWNLRPSVAEENIPVLATTGDTALVSGFSGMMMKAFLHGGEDLLEDMNPIQLMEAAISGPEFAELKVFD
ncbi:hypothetical protein BGZ73_000912 [Actinomortierella ambigua]|nr:hypothetical protein BGZ73_000912 [Actinomortierella ambigua]